MKLLFIRHAEPDYSIDGLTPKGKVEAELLSERLLKTKIDDIYLSPKGRAQATAVPYLEKSGRTGETLPWLAEFRGNSFDPDAGRNRICWDYSPRFWTARPKLLSVDTWQDDEMYAGSNVKQIWKETVEGTDELLGKYGFRKSGAIWTSENNRDVTVACFCHFGISMAIMGHLMNISPIVLWHNFFMAPSSVTLVVSEERKEGEVVWRCAKMGDLTHLESAGEPWSTAGLFPEICTGIESTDPQTNGTLR